jgi:glycosyltransferase involved in cell wall biosynthesis
MRLNVISNALASLGQADLLLIPLRMMPAEQSVFNRVLITPQCDEESAITRITNTRARLPGLLPDWLKETPYDLVWYSRERSWMMTRGTVEAPSIIDVDDLEEIILRQWISIGKDDHGEPLSAGSRKRMTNEIGWWKSVHQKVAEEASVLVFASKKDQDHIGARRSVVVPNTYMQPTRPQPPRPDNHTILFQGILQWAPNEDAAEWLVKEIAPLIRAQVPDLQVVLAGLPSSRILALASHPGVQVTGAVPEMIPYLHSAQLAVAPIRVGSGTRIKILEAFAHHVPVVSTHIGAAGLDAVPGVHLELSNSPAGFAQHCVHLLTNRPAAQQLTHAAHDLYQRSYQPARAQQRVHQAVQKALERIGAANLYLPG